jgi:hypothetical protein
MRWNDSLTATKSPISDLLRVYLKLVYWGKVVKEGEGIVGGVYREGRRRVQGGSAGRKEWCSEVKCLLEEVGLGGCWGSERVGTVREWKSRVLKAVGRWEEQKWRWGMVRKGYNAKVKLETYMRVKKRLEKEWFLTKRRVWVRRWVRLRAGVERLEVELGRYRGVKRWNRRCSTSNNVDGCSHG